MAPVPVAEASRLRWRRSQAVTAWLLAVWFVVTFGVAYFARELSGLLLGWPFSFWVAAQGALLIYLLLVVVYAGAMRRLDERYGLAEAD
jgi:putative solute:sodium symporter small subunit